MPAFSYLDLSASDRSLAGNAPEDSRGVYSYSYTQVIFIYLPHITMLSYQSKLIKCVQPK